MSEKIIFMGTPMFAVPILKSLYQNGYEISVVYTQPPQKSHRGQKLMDDMLETMYAAPGIGLAAIQVGVPKRVIVIDIGSRDES